MIKPQIIDTWMQLCGESIEDDVATAVVTVSPVDLRSMISELLRLRATVPPREPDGYAYRRKSPIDSNETYIAFDHGSYVNGELPMETVPYWIGPASPTEFPKQPHECAHELAQFACADCGIAYPRASVVNPPFVVQALNAERAIWFVVTYEWQGAPNLSDSKIWYSSAEIFRSKQSAQSTMDRHLKSSHPCAGRITYRNVRGPFEWLAPPDVRDGP